MVTLAIAERATGAAHLAAVWVGNSGVVGAYLMPDANQPILAELKELTEQLHAARLRKIEAVRLGDHAARIAAIYSIGQLSAEIRKAEQRLREGTLGA